MYRRSVQGNAQTPLHVINAERDLAKGQGQKTVPSDSETQRSGDPAIEAGNADPDRHKPSREAAASAGMAEGRAETASLSPSGAGVGVEGNAPVPVKRVTRLSQSHRTEDGHFLHLNPDQ